MHARYFTPVLLSFLCIIAAGFIGIDKIHFFAPGVITELRCNEGSGTSLADASGNAHNGTLVNGPTWGVGKYGQGVNLDGSNDYISIADHANFTLDPAQSYTWSAWVKNNNFTEWSTVWSQTIDANNFFYFYAHTSSDPIGGPVTNGVSVYWWVNGGSSRVGVHSNNNVLTAGQWSYVTVTYNGSLAQNSRFSIYVNGVDVTNRSDIASSGTITTINPTNIRAGSNQPFGEYLTGSIDELRYYRRILTLQEIQSDMNIGNVVDVTAPSVELTSPAAGVVSGTVNVTAAATDDIGVAGVQFLLDGANLGTEDITSPYTISWNTETVSNGAHQLTAVARDAAGNTTTSAAVIVNVNNVPDTEGPSVTLTSPVAGTVNGLVSVSATASDNTSVAGVQFLLNGVNLGAEDVIAPYSYSWNTVSTANGNYTLTARARDAAGNTSVSSAITVTVFNNNLVAAYGFNENTGVTTADNSGNNNHGTLTNGPVWSAEGRFGAALSFDGSNDLVNVVDANSLDLTNGMTLEAWVRPTNLTGYKTILAKENGTNNLAYILSANNSTSGAANQRPNSRIRIGSATRTVTGTSKLALNTWSHVASTYDGANFRIYLNGVLVSTFATTGNIAVTTNAFRIGGCPSLGTQYFAGLIDEVRVYNRALTAAEIQSDMNTPVAPDLTPPAISITTPLAGIVSGDINITATASDNISVTGVQFKVDGANFGAEDLVAPYAIPWNTTTLANGNHVLSAVARDAAGNTATSEVVVTVNNVVDEEPPVVTINNPVAGTVNGLINITATASDNTAVAGVQFQLDGANLGAEDLLAPFTTSWNTALVGNGSHTITAIARDAAGNTSVSEQVVVLVDNDIAGPSVEITSPTAGDVLGNIDLVAEASDPSGVAGVQFLLNGASLSAEDLVAPYSIPWNTLSLPNGSYTLTARARDVLGNIATSLAVVVNVNNPPDTELPLVTISSPASGTVSGSVNVSASATDNIGIAGVQFLLNGLNLGSEDVTAPFTVSWNTSTSPNGSYQLTAIARDAAGNLSISPAVTVTVANATNLISSHNFNEGSGTLAADLSGNSHNATIVNGATWTAGKFGTGLALDGTNDYVNIPDHANFTLVPTESYTWSGWVKNNNFLQWSTVWSQTIDASNFFYFYAHTSSDPDAGPVTNGISVYWWTNGGSNKLAAHSSNNVLTAGQWSYITITYNGTLAQNSRFSIYVNGVDVTARTDISSTGTLATLNPTNIRIGSNQPFGEYLNGAIDEMRFYRRLLTPAEILADMNTPIGIDNIPPSVTITSPAPGNVAGVVNVTATANDNLAVSGVQFLVDGTPLGDEDVSAPYSVSWNTSLATPGTHVLTARAKDATGNTTTSAGVTVVIAPDFLLAVTPSVRTIDSTATTDFGISVSYLNGFSGSNLLLSVSGLPAGITAAFTPNPMTGPGQSQLNISAIDAEPGVYTLTITGVAESISHSVNVTLNINGAADFSLSASPSVQNVAAGSGTSFFINVSESGDFTSPVSLSISGLPSGMSASFNPGSAVPPSTSVLTVTTTSSVPLNTYNLTVTGQSGAVTKTLPLSITVMATSPSNWPTTNLGSGWDMPIGVQFSKDGQKMFVWEKGGKVYVCNRNAATQLYDKQMTPVIDISPEVGNWDDMGCLGFALDPNFELNGLIYLLYIVDRHHLLNFGTPAYDPPPGDNASARKATIGRVSRYQVVNNGGVLTANPATRKVLLGERKTNGVPILYDSHGVGSLFFAADGTLIISTGDGASYSTLDAGSISHTYYVQALADTIIRANENVGAFRSQMLNSLNGKILRIDPVTGDGVPSNPFYDPLNPRSAKSRVYTLGLRNPYRVSVKPGTGSTNPLSGDIGEIYVADVGMGSWEELTVIKEPGMNCGWPLYEGLQSFPEFHTLVTENKDEPNPLFGVGGCNKRYFTFQELLKQATGDNNRTVFNPCNSAIPIGTGNRYFHRRPMLDTRHDQDVTRVGKFSGNVASVATIGTPASGVVGAPYRGNCIIGGFWYTGNLFPANFRNTYFYGDYGRSYIKSLTVNFTDVLQKAEHFADAANIVSLAENPFDGSMVYVDIGNNLVKRISYGGNQFPVVKMTASQTYGPSDLSVSFTGSGSYDPEGGRLTYSWNFGDGSPVSTLANPPVKVFTAPANTPRKYVVTLTVRDSVNAVAVDSIVISVNNTHPVVNITSPVKNSTYEIGLDSVYAFTATVTDAEHNAGQLKYEWQQYLRHDTHEHPGPVDTVRNTFGSISRIGCNGDEYYWMIRLKVTDAAGLYTIDSSKIFPNCSSVQAALSLRKFSVSQAENQNVVKWITDLAPQIKRFEVERSVDGINFYSIDHQVANKATGHSEYQFVDNMFFPGENYYRLKMIEVGSVIKYSATVKTFTELKSATLSVSPNPVTGNYSIRYTSKGKGPVTIRIVDMNGREVQSIQETVNAGQNIIYLQDFPTWKPGTYIITVRQGAETQRVKMLYLGRQK